MGANCSMKLFNEILMRRLMVLLQENPIMSCGRGVKEGSAGPGSGLLGRRFRQAVGISADFMASKTKVQLCYSESISSLMQLSPLMQLRYYSSKVDWPKLRPVVHEQIRCLDRNYTTSRDVLKARAVLSEGVSTLLKVFPIKKCKFCDEVYVGDIGHQMKTCSRSKRVRNQLHGWTNGSIKDILIPVDIYQQVPQDVIGNNQTFKQVRISAIVELCHQAAPKISQHVPDSRPEIIANSEVGGSGSTTTMPSDLKNLAHRTLEAWEILRSGTRKLLLARPAKICMQCSEVHIGSSEYKAKGLNRMCRQSHKWKEAGVDDFMPSKLVWHRRPQDPPVLVDSGRCYYGRAPAVISLCVQAGAKVPAKFTAMMKSLGLSKT